LVMIQKTIKSLLLVIIPVKLGIICKAIIYCNGVTAKPKPYTIIKKTDYSKKILIDNHSGDIQPMLKRLKAFIQQYKNRLIENR